MGSGEPSSMIGFVVIGRNEGERLKLGLHAIQRLCPGCAVVYVDSGSSDDSVDFAKSLGVHTVDLDVSIPFTAARARNAGFARLLEARPELKYVQFLDGDCELLPGWIACALEKLERHPEIAIVSGRRMERFPETSIYNKLMDIEWNTATGEAAAVPGDMCVRTAVFRAVEGFCNSIIAAEDDDLCVRVRQRGHKVFRIDARMSMHDANITRLSQWWKRSMRGGHGYAQVHFIHRASPEHYFRRQLVSAAVWGGVVPIIFCLALGILPIVAIAVGLAYVGWVARTIVRRLRLGNDPEVAVAYGVLIFTGKVLELAGAVQFYKNHFLSRKHVLIEYK